MIRKSECAGWASLAFIAIGTFRSLAGCSAAQAGADTAYAAKQLACVDMASTRDAATACRNCVKAAIAAGKDSDGCYDGLR